MLEYLARHLAEILTKGDVMELFRMLEERYGSISGVCERVGIERRTFYNWRYARQMNNETKAKVLRAALEDYPIDTLEFIARKARGRLREVLELLIEYLRKGIAEEGRLNNAESLARRAEEIINEFSIPITEYLRHEIAGLIETANARGLEIRVQQYMSAQVREAAISAAAEKYRPYPQKVISLQTYAEQTSSTTGTLAVLVTNEFRIPEQMSPHDLPY